MFKQRWLPLVLVIIIGFSGVLYLGIRTYQDAPPRPTYLDPQGNIVFSYQDILDGQAVFMKYALMNYGSMFGDGAIRGADFTAEALNVWGKATATQYRKDDTTGNLAEYVVSEAVRKDMKANTYKEARNSVTLSAAQSAAFSDVVKFYQDKFTGNIPESFSPRNYINNMAEIRSLAAFFTWGAWVCAAERPGVSYSYTHNWPYDPSVGNVATAPAIYWSIFGFFAFILGLGVVLYYYGRYDKAAEFDPEPQTNPLLTENRLQSVQIADVQRATYKYFLVASILFLLQVLAGALTIHDFLGFTVFFGVDISQWLPVTIVRSWHVQLALLWISLCWMGASIFIIPLIGGRQDRTQLYLTNLLFWSLIVIAVGSLTGEYLGPHNFLGSWWYWFGNQGWEFLELGKAWQALLYCCFGLWAYIMWRGARDAIRNRERWSLPAWLFYAIICVLILFTAGFVATPKTNFVIADFWRWMTIHMWVEAFFEVFTTIIVASFFVLMGLSKKSSAIRVIYIAAILFLGSGIMGVAHNFYWNAKPEITLAMGSVFSTLQALPLMLLTISAWRYRNQPTSMLKEAARNGGKQEVFAHSGAFLFMLGVNFWNFMGAGVFGAIINLPIVNYYEHGTYLTVNHGHAALMGVYGNLAIAAILFCTRYLLRDRQWKDGTIKVIFISLNLGLVLMVVLDLFPAGILQLQEVLENGLWAGRSETFIASVQFQTYTWMRAIGGILFVLGGVIPLMLFLFKRSGPVLSKSGSTPL